LDVVGIYPDASGNPETTVIFTFRPAKKSGVSTGGITLYRGTGISNLQGAKKLMESYGYVVDTKDIAGF
jgi:hypothetical protein